MQKTSHPIEPAEIMAYLDGELPPTRAAAAAGHLERCPDCQALAVDLRSVSQGLLAWQVESTAAEPTPALHAALTQRFDRRDGYRLRPWVWVLASAAVLVVAISIRLPERTMRMSLVPGQAEPNPAARAALSYAKPDEEVFKLPAPAAPMIARTAALSLTAREFDRVRAAVDDVLQRHKGYLATLQINAPADGQRTLSASLRVPAAQLAASLAELKQLGRVDQEQQSGEEVTAQYVDLESRLTNARHTEDRLTAILRDRTGKLSDVLDVEKELDRVRGEIEQMEGEKKALTTRVDFATVNLTVTEVYKARLEVTPDSTAGRLRNAAVEGYQTMIGGLIELALWIAHSGPTVVLWTALLFFPVRIVWRRWRRSN